jgi:hypothetical protein
LAHSQVRKGAKLVYFSLGRSDVNLFRYGNIVNLDAEIPDLFPAQ